MLREDQMIADVKYELHLKNRIITSDLHGNTGTVAVYGLIRIIKGDLSAEAEVKDAPFTLVIEDGMQFLFTVKGGNITDNLIHIQGLGSS